MTAPIGGYCCGSCGFTLVMGVDGVYRCPNPSCYIGPAPPLSISVYTSELIADTRPIAGVFWPDQDATHHVAGETCDSIEAYMEPGPTGFVPWIKVVKGGEVILRVPAHQVEVTYSSEPGTHPSNDGETPH